jgi:Uma2 family endonuclease
MVEALKKRAVYEDLYTIPEHMTGEIIGGELVLTPRPSRFHAYSAASLGGRLITPYQFGEGSGPGGWVILIEPEIGLGEDILVPDLAGWKRERFPVRESHNWISIPPDWLCEVLSPGTAGKDKIKKMPIYAQSRIPYVWMVDPLEKTLEIFRLESGRWVVAGLYGESDRVRGEPFLELEIDLGSLWL